MALTVKLMRGARVLNLNSGRYTVASGFAPPATQLSPRMAAGTSANRHGGAVRVGVSAVNRPWSFGVNVRAASPAEVTRALADLAYMCSLAGDEDEPLYLFFKLDANLSSAPTWGQDGHYYELAHAAVPQPGSGATLAHTRGLASMGVTVACEVKPYAIGQRQRVMSGIGGLLEFDWGAADGQSRGLLVGESATNKMTNPIFGHSTFSNGWTASNVIASQNTDPRYVLFGLNSVRLIATGSPGTYTQSINVGNTNAHYIVAYVKKPDGSAVTTSDVVIHYGSAQSSTVQALGDGWYMVWASPNGVASSTATGVSIPADKEVYLAGVTCVERTNYPVHMAHGDLLGCAWTGTAHDSTSTRTAGRVRLPSAGLFSTGHGTLRIAVLPWIGSGQMSGLDCYLFSFGSSNMRALWQNSGGELRWRFIGSDNSNAANSNATTFTRDVPLVFHFVWGDDALVIYLNGTAIATDASGLAPTALGTYLYLGSDDSAANHFPGVFQDLTAWDVSLTAAEVLADYNNLSPVIADGQRVSAIPWLWTNDGDDTVDSYYNGTAFNTFVCGGIPGSAPATTSLKITESTALRGIWLGRLASKRPIPPSVFFEDQSGTSTTSADVGSAVQTVSVAAGSGGSSIQLEIPNRFYDLFQGHEWTMFVRLSDASTGLSIRQWLLYTGGGVAGYESEWQSASLADSTRRLFKTRPLTYPIQKRIYGVSPNVWVTNAAALAMDRSGSTGNVSVDYIFVMPGPITHIDLPNATSETILFVDGRYVQVATTVNEILEEAAYLYGDEFELLPNAYNQVVCAIGGIGVSSTITHAFTVTTLLVRPRYALL